MRRSALDIQVLAGLICTALAGPICAEELAITELVCRPPNTKETIPISEEPISSQDAAYQADMEERRLFFNPRIASRLPKAVIKLDFARACLKVIDMESSTCAAVKFLNYRGAINKEDVSELENYYGDLAERYPKKATEYYKTLKQIISCF